MPDLDQGAQEASPGTSLILADFDPGPSCHTLASHTLPVLTMQLVIPTKYLGIVPSTI